jgi:hypothetical protein
VSERSGDEVNLSKGTPSGDQDVPPPSWADPQATPPGQPSPYGPPAGQGPAAATPSGDPATAPGYPPAAPYGAAPGYPPADPYGAPAGYGQPAGYPPAPGYGAPPGYGYPPPAPTPTSAIVLVVLSGLATATCWGALAGLPGLILGIIALTGNSTDPERSRRMTRIGWITFGSVSLFTVLAVAAFIVIAVTADSGGGF